MVIAEKVIKLAIKMIVKRFKLDKLEEVYAYVFGQNELDETVKDLKKEQVQQKKRMDKMEELISRSPIKKAELKKWYEK